jgi:hypothetical protein
VKRERRESREIAGGGEAAEGQKAESREKRVESREKRVRERARENAREREKDE